MARLCRLGFLIEQLLERWRGQSCLHLQLRGASGDKSPSADREEEEAPPLRLSAAVTPLRFFLLTVEETSVPRTADLHAQSQERRPLVNIRPPGRRVFGVEEGLLTRSSHYAPVTQPGRASISRSMSRCQGPGTAATQAGEKKTQPKVKPKIETRSNLRFPAHWSDERARAPRLRVACTSIQTQLSAAFNSLRPPPGLIQGELPIIGLLFSHINAAGTSRCARSLWIYVHLRAAAPIDTHPPHLCNI